MMPVLPPPEVIVYPCTGSYDALCESLVSRLSVTPQHDATWHQRPGCSSLLTELFVILEFIRQTSIIACPYGLSMWAGRSNLRNLLQRGERRGGLVATVSFLSSQCISSSERSHL